MTLSRRAPGLCLAFAASPAFAQVPIDYSLPPSPQPMLNTDIRPDCPTRSADDEIVVCGTRDDDARYRVEPSRLPPSAANRAGGEQMSALNAGSGRCSTTGPHVQCAGGLDVLGIIFGVARAIARARANRD